jgi:hypothetical protein
MYTSKTWLTRSNGKVLRFSPRQDGDIQSKFWSASKSSAVCMNIAISRGLHSSVVYRPSFVWGCHYQVLWRRMAWMMINDVVWCVVDVLYMWLWWCKISLVRSIVDTPIIQTSNMHDIYLLTLSRCSHICFACWRWWFHGRVGSVRQVMGDGSSDGCDVDGYGNRIVRPLSKPKAI